MAPAANAAEEPIAEVSGFTNELSADTQTTSFVQQSVTTDINDSSAFAVDIIWVADKGIVRDYGDGSFKPDANFSRDAMDAFFYRMAGSPDFKAPEVSPFKDVPTDYQFYTEVAWLAPNGITTGYADGTFHPEKSINRDAMAAFLYRFVGSPTYNAPPPPLSKTSQ